MVTINLTILVQLGLFLGFMWLMSTYVFKPMLHLMDERSEGMARDKESAETLVQEAEKLESRYIGKISEINREASHQAYHARRAAQEAHNQTVAELRQREEEEVARAHAEAMAEVREERQKYPELTAALSEDIARLLGLKGDES